MRNRSDSKTEHFQREKGKRKVFPYVCVRCGHPVEEMYKQYSDSVLKLATCGSCHNFADKYIEYDGAIILIDLILFNKEAYRHIVFNTPFNNHWKLALLLLLVKSYEDWSTYKMLKKDVTNTHSAENNFYFTALVISISSAISFLMVLLLVLLTWRGVPKTNQKKNAIVSIWKSYICSSLGYFLLVPSLVWSDYHRELHIIFIIFYIFISQVQALSVTCNTSRVLLIVFIIIANFCEFWVAKYLMFLISSLW